MDAVADQFEATLDEIDRLDEQKTPLVKRHSKHKSSVRSKMKRKFEETLAENPETTEVTMKLGNTTFKLEEIESCPPCKDDDLEQYFSPENVAKYREARTKKRLKLSFERE